MDLPRIDGRVALLGIGDTLRGDDGVGPRIARALKFLPFSDNCLFVDAGVSPEAYTGTVREFAPDLVLLVDAVEMGAPPGHVEWFEGWDSDQVSAWTHGLPLEVLAEFLDCRVMLLGIQPATTDFGQQRLSPAVRAAARRLLVSLRQVLAAECCDDCSRIHADCPKGRGLRRSKLVRSPSMAEPQAADE